MNQEGYMRGEAPTKSDLLGELGIRKNYNYLVGIEKQHLLSNESGGCFFASLSSFCVELDSIA